jgi:predicted nucleic acid-binding protein
MAAFENALEAALKLGLSSKDAVILATAKAQGTKLVTQDKAIIEAAKKIGVEIK